ncbi:MAG: hypothetical protein AVDCRST_MAG93-2856 [uncultured Chloroflexia bacterium]|uniref:Uncharacterized protein n=1 Tax=uncultured Chloroflexia bacterium TaxID=1672391 RepID=A0A6J4JG43_9CHLR|nr:MAG: hypothetical protein AVDCRST_MAG93-2856 [uncultured Chloroflexia bacterium]
MASGRQPEHHELQSVDGRSMTTVLPGQWRMRHVASTVLTDVVKKGMRGGAALAAQ